MTETQQVNTHRYADRVSVLRCAHRALSMVGLLLIALGTGGIKPCVAAFGGDQFEDHQVRCRSSTPRSIHLIGYLKNTLPVRPSHRVPLC